jgi:hypothetical protein
VEAAQRDQGGSLEYSAAALGCMIDPYVLSAVMLSGAPGQDRRDPTKAVRGDQ